MLPPCISSRVPSQPELLCQLLGRGVGVSVQTVTRRCRPFFRSLCPPPGGLPCPFSTGLQFGRPFPTCRLFQAHLYFPCRDCGVTEEPWLLLLESRVWGAGLGPGGPCTGVPLPAPQAPRTHPRLPTRTCTACRGSHLDLRFKPKSTGLLPVDPSSFKGPWFLSPSGLNGLFSPDGRQRGSDFPHTGRRRRGAVWGARPCLTRVLFSLTVAGTVLVSKSPPGCPSSGRCLFPSGSIATVCFWGAALPWSDRQGCVCVHGAGFPSTTSFPRSTLCVFWGPLPSRRPLSAFSCDMFGAHSVSPWREPPLAFHSTWCFTDRMLQLSQPCAQTQAVLP